MLAIGCTLPVFALAAATGARHHTLRTGHGGHLYVVKKGDTLWSIASTHFKNPWKWRHIHKLNKKSIKNPHWIYPGQVIDLDRLEQELRWINPGEEIVLEELLPALGLENGPDPAADRSAYFVVKKGDTLWGIAAMHYKDHWKWHKVWKLNKKSIRNPHWIYPGQVFTLAEPLPLEPIAEEPATVKTAEVKPPIVTTPRSMPTPAPAPAPPPAPVRVPAPVPAHAPAPAPAPAPIPAPAPARAPAPAPSPSPGTCAHACSGHCGPCHFHL